MERIRREIPAKVEQNDACLKTVEKAEKHLVFFDIEKLRNIDKFQGKLITILESCK